jgi:hypothetical protein
MLQTVKLIRGTRLHETLKNRFNNRKTTCHVSIYDETEKVVQTSIGGWDGGSRDIDHLLTGGRMVENVTQMQPFGGLREPPKVTLDQTHALVTTGTFCGKTATIHIKCTKEYWDNYLA